MWNLLQIGFLGTTALFSSVGYLVKCHENSLPAALLRIAKYGCFAYDGDKAKFMKKMEVPKSYYRHYYLFACTFQLFNLMYMIFVYFWGFEIDKHYAKLLHAFHGKDTSPVSVLASVSAMSLLTVHCLRRCYETHYVQVFAKSSRMNLSHYILGLLHYLALSVAIVGQAPMFCGEKNKDKIVWADLWTITMLLPGIPIFFWAWVKQYQSNVILANLRKDKKSGEVVTEEHQIPRGELFESVSSPHRYYEIILYAVLLAILKSKTFFCIFIWVVFNQVNTSLLVHQWYRKTFKNYPVERYAIFKGIL